MTKQSKTPSAVTIAKARRNGDGWETILSDLGINGIKGRKLLAEAGFNAKGEKSELAPITGSGQALAKKLVALRNEGVALYELALRTGKSESEVRSIIEEAGGPTSRVYVSRSGDKPAAKKATKKTTRKSSANGSKKTAAKPSAASKSAKTKVKRRRRQEVADPSPQA